MSETPSNPEVENHTLSLEEFARRSPTYPQYNNFFLHFSGGTGFIYRKREYYRRFAEEHPDIATTLCDKIQNRDRRGNSTSESLKPFDADLYEAYKIMKSYGVSNRELFG